MTSVFVRTPVSRSARPTRSASRSSVVRMHISMHDSYASGDPRGLTRSGEVEHLAERDADTGHEISAEPSEGPLDEAVVVDGPKLVDEQI